MHAKSSRGRANKPQRFTLLRELVTIGQTHTEGIDRRRRACGGISQILRDAAGPLELARTVEDAWGLPTLEHEAVFRHILAWANWREAEALRATMQAWVAEGWVTRGEGRVEALRAVAAALRAAKVGHLGQRLALVGHLEDAVGGNASEQRAVLAVASRWCDAVVDGLLSRLGHAS